MADWEWKIANISSSKSTSFPSVAPDEGEDTYGGRYVYDDEEPLIRLTFRAVGVPEEDKDTIFAAYLAKKTPYTLTDKLGTEHHGYLTGIQIENVSGCDRWNIDLEMTKVLTELGGS